MIRVSLLDKDPAHLARWNEFVAASNNGTVFHDIRFLDYHPADRFTFRHLLFHDDSELVAVLPGGVAGSSFRSPMGASFGGFVAKEALPLPVADQVVKAFISWCREQNLTEALLTPPMQVYHRTFDESLEYAMLYNGFTVHNALYSSVIDFSRIRGKEDLSRNTRHKINQSLNKGVRIEESDDYDTFYPILLENKAKFGVKPTHTLEDLKRIAQLVPGMMALSMAYYQNEPVAGQLLFAANNRCVLNFYTMHRYEHHNLHAVNAIVEHGFRWCIDKGYRWYDYGVSADTFSSNPMDPSWSLVRFKESMGSTGCMRVTYKWGVGSG
jgi:hypothetical protein